MTELISYGVMISIHALREEGDSWISPKSSTNAISIHALREEGDGLCCEGRRFER